MKTILAENRDALFLLRRRRKLPPPAPARHQWIKQRLVAHGATLWRLVADVLAEVNQFEGLHHPRKRARRPSDRQSHEALVRVIVVNLALASINPPQTGRL